MSKTLKLDRLLRPAALAILALLSTTAANASYYDHYCTVAVTPAGAGYITAESQSGNFTTSQEISWHSTNYYIDRVITAHANQGYMFIKWSDGTTDLSREITVPMNNQSSQQTYTAKFIKKTPDITISTPSKWYNSRSLAISGSCSDGYTVAVYDGSSKLGDATISGTDWSYTYNAASDLNGKTLTFKASSTVDGTGKNSATFNVYIDTQKPVFSSFGDTICPNMYKRGTDIIFKKGSNATVTANYTDAAPSSSNLKYTASRLNGQWLTTNKVTLSTTAEGSFDDNVFAKDSAGNQSDPGVPISYKVDGTGPAVQNFVIEPVELKDSTRVIKSASGKYWLQKYVNVLAKASISDPENNSVKSGFKSATLMGSAYANGQFAINTENQIHEVDTVIVATDSVGNETRFRINKIGIDSNAPNIHFNMPVTVDDHHEGKDWSGVSLVQYYYKDEGSTIIDYNGKDFDILSSGQIYFSAYDSVGNMCMLSLMAAQDRHSVMYDDTVIYANIDSLGTLKVQYGAKAIRGNLMKDSTGLKVLYIPETVNLIEDYAFSGCANLDTIYINSPSINIATNAFNGVNAKVYIANNYYTNYSSKLTGMQHERIVKTVTYKADGSWGTIKEDSGKFMLDSTVTVAAMPKTSDYFFVNWKHADGTTATDSCHTFTIGSKPDTLTAIFTDTIRRNGVCYQTIKNQKNELQVIKDPVSKYQGKVVIPDTIHYMANNETEQVYKVTVISNDAFRECSNLTGIEIGENVSLISGSGFQDCYSLESVTIKGNGLDSIGSLAFSHCYALKRMAIGTEKPAKLGNNVWEGLPAQSVLMAIKAKAIDSYRNTAQWKDRVYYLFKDSIWYEIIDDSAHVKVVNNQKGSVYNMDSVEITNPLDYYGENYYVVEVGETAFENSTVKDIILPSTVTKIDSAAFAGCTQLQALELRAMSIVTPGNDAFSGAYSRIMLYVPAELNELYKADSRWQGYSTRMSHLVTVTNAGWATFYTYNNVKAESDNTSTYIPSLAAKSDTVMLDLGEPYAVGTVLPSITGFIIGAPEGIYRYTVTSISSPVTAKSALSGTILDRPFSYSDYLGKVYTLATLDGVTSFYRFVGKTLTAGHAFLDVRSSQKSIDFGWKDGTTGIEAASVTDGASVYNLAGQKVERITVPGLYIVNGKKMYVK